MSNFYTDVIQKDARFTSTNSCRDTSLLEPWFRAAVAAILAGAKAKGIGLIVTETYRSSERQQQLYAQGKTQLRTVGVHHYGLAADFAKLVDGQASWDGDWAFLRDLADENRVISGLDWGAPDAKHSFTDDDHVQGCTVAQQSALFAGTWYPDAASGVGGVAPVPPPLNAPPAPVAAPVPPGLSAVQQSILTDLDALNAQYFANFFWRSSIFAFCEVESEFNAQAYRREPSGVASYGLMQVLDSTAAGLGLEGDADQMYDVKTSLFYGMKYAATGWNYLQAHLGRMPTLKEWSEGYNEGYGAAANGRPDPNYSDKWLPAQQHWASVFGE